jgi:hypothetical protein
VVKDFIEQKPHMMLRMTKKGRSAFEEYRQSMDRLFKEPP